MALEKKSYSDKLKDPRWQKKRLEIMQRDGFKCGICTDGGNTLHVHHKFYKYGTEPWDYSDDVLITLCATCHEFEEVCKAGFQEKIQLLLREGFTYYGLVHVAMYLRDFPKTFSEGRMLRAIHAICNDPELIEEILSKKQD